MNNRIRLADFANVAGQVADADALAAFVQTLDLQQSDFFAIHATPAVRLVSARAWSALLNPLWGAWLPRHHGTAVWEQVEWARGLGKPDRLPKAVWIGEQLQETYDKGPVRMALEDEDKMDGPVVSQMVHQFRRWNTDIIADYVSAKWPGEFLSRQEMAARRARE